MDHQFTEQLQQWMNTPDEQKDWAAGALFLLQLTGNKIMYRNISVNPKGKAEFIKGNIRKYLNFRLQQLTHDEVLEMQQKVEVIAKETIKPEAEFADFKAGKRADHESLPDDIKALYVENLDIVHRMRELHMKLRSLSLEEATCPDSERYPFLKEIISLDKKLHENWDAYDHFVVAADAPKVDEGSETSDESEDPAAGESPVSEDKSPSETEDDASESKGEEASQEQAPEDKTESSETSSDGSSEVSESPAKKTRAKSTSAKTKASSSKALKSKKTAKEKATEV